ncbi:Iron-uptake system permease protein FeuB [Paenibacillus solanacearum]|uniref:Iron-uptake system permease protein FeuB n=1 Tax=Paenibacillus solanacearum TaxID=2048548 RepID=A0A916NR87_9BACL|nr:iron ABC transporter permease [Paenibacillus solanacearum]CAG7638383.1 Iron-uptake system permease protein FeuB [Paenibacillus solanacearum]
MKQRKSFKTASLIAVPVALVLATLLSISFGAKSMDLATVWDAFRHFDEGNVDHQIIMHSRVPRAVGSLMIGAFLAISGAVMQGMTRNYLASPSIMGVTDGSAFAITVGMVFAADTSSMELILYSLIGSALGVGIVYGMALLLPGGQSPVRMAIIGTVIGTFLSGFSAAIATYYQVSQNISFWYNARLHQLDPTLIKLAIPFGIVGIVLSLLISRSITILSLGEEVSVGLGQRTWLVRGVATAAVVFLTGISVAIAGKVGFVGLIIPHIARFLVGIDYRRIIPCAGILGALFLAVCDILSRFLIYPFEMPIGVVTALFGVPVFLYLIRKRGGGKHV